jgi:hypothetical protein
VISTVGGGPDCALASFNNIPDGSMKKLTSVNNTSRIGIVRILLMV